MRNQMIAPALLSLSLLAFTSAVRADDVVIGGLEGNGEVFVGSSVHLLIDRSHPANAAGSVTTATVRWSQATTPCDAIFYVDFFAMPGNAFAAVRIAERGPFAAANGLNTVTLDPPVSITTETFIGIRRSDGPDSCGQVSGTFTRPRSQSLYSTTDFSGGNISTLSPIADFAIQAQASSTPSVRVSTLPVVGSVAGSHDSFFRTSLTLSNPAPLTIHGKLVLRVANRPGSNADPSFDYVIPPNGTLNYDDILATMSQSGLGSLDILTTGSPTPLASARVFNDTPTGTSGFSEEAIPAGAPYLNLTNIFIPKDLTNFRLNIGVRTFAATDLNVTIYDASGNQSDSLTKSYDANFFAQVPAATFVGGASLPAGGRIVIQAYQKEFLAYGAVTDNRTNDPSMRLGLD